jgi:8-oxo-dGTP diphosphatase
LAGKQPPRLSDSLTDTSCTIPQGEPDLTESLKVTTVVAGILLREERILICQRREDQSFPLQWEFPGGKAEPGEALPEALARELDEELGIAASVGPELACLRHHYAEGLAVELHFLLVTEFSGEIENRIFRELRWVMRKELEAEIFLEADRDIVRCSRARALSNRRSL